MNRNIVLLCPVRENSSRVNDKLLRNFSDTCLFEICLKKLVEIEKMKNPFSDILVAIYKGDKRLWELAENYGVKIIERNKKSITRGTEKQSDIQHYLKDSPYKYALNLNACVPFIKPETIINTGNVFSNHSEYQSLVCGQYIYNFFWDKDLCKPINNPDETNTATQRVTPLIGENGSMVIYNIDYMFNNNRYWSFSKNDPYIHILDDTDEFLDIDNDIDFRLCEEIYENNNS